MAQHSLVSNNFVCVTKMYGLTDRDWAQDLLHCRLVLNNWAAETAIFIPYCFGVSQYAFRNLARIPLIATKSVHWVSHLSPINRNEWKCRVELGIEPVISLIKGKCFDTWATYTTKILNQFFFCEVLYDLMYLVICLLFHRCSLLTKQNVLSCWPSVRLSICLLIFSLWLNHSSSF